MNILPVIYACIKLWADLLCANITFQLGPFIKRAQQEQFDNTSINIKFPCPCVDTWSIARLHDCSHMKYAHILHITQ